MEFIVISVITIQTQWKLISSFICFLNCNILPSTLPLISSRSCQHHQVISLLFILSLPLFPLSPPSLSLSIAFKSFLFIIYPVSCYSLSRSNISLFTLTFSLLPFCLAIKAVSSFNNRSCAFFFPELIFRCSFFSKFSSLFKQFSSHNIHARVYEWVLKRGA